MKLLGVLSKLIFLKKKANCLINGNYFSKPHLFAIVFFMSISIYCNSQTNTYHQFLHDGGKWSILNRTWIMGMEGDTS